MLAYEILDTSFEPLTLKSSVEAALLKMDLAGATKFPVVDEANKLIGMAVLEILAGKESRTDAILECELEAPVYVNYMNHVFEASRVMLSNEIFVLPVVDMEMNFKGMLDKEDLIQVLGHIFNLDAAGSVITIVLDDYDFSLSEPVRIIENESARILGIAVKRPQAEAPQFQVSFKLHVTDSSGVSAALRRYGYVVLSEANSEALDNDMSSRTDELIRYLDI